MIWPSKDLPHGFSDDHLSAQTISPWLSKAFTDLISERMGLDIKTQDQPAIDQTILTRANILEQPSLENYYQLLANDTLESDREWSHLSKFLTNPESFFFRDQGQFSVLQHHIIPTLIQRKSVEKKLRICSAGCATGEEAYSIAILLSLLIPELDQWDVRIYGLDINPVSIAYAKAGIYGDWSLRGLSANQKQAYFHHVKNQYHIRPKFKQPVRFHALNLVNDPLRLVTEEKPSPVPVPNPLESLDLIICRNVFISHLAPLR